MMMNTASGLVCRRQGAWRRPLVRMISSSSNDTTVGAFTSAFSSTSFVDVSSNTSSSTMVGDSGNCCTSESMASFRYSIPRNHNKARAPPTLKPGFQPTGINKDGVFVGSTFFMLSPQTLPELDVAPLLNKTVYTRKVGTSIHGGDAAIRLYKAKNALRSTIETELNSTSVVTHEVKKMYILKRHGVPNQLLQHLVTVADRWLEDKNALELWVDSSCQGSLSVFTTEGASWRTLWPLEWDDDVSLYLAVMKRIVSHLGSMTPFCEGASVMPGDLQWKVSISRNNKLPLTLFPRHEPGEVLPVVEWVTPSQKDEATTSSSSKIGKILIRMQGATNPIADDVTQGHDVSFTFEANFDTTNTTRITTSESSC